MSTITPPEGVEITAEVPPEMAEILTPEASRSWRSCTGRSSRAGASCSARAPSAPRALDAGELPDFLPETAHIRDARSGRWRPRPPTSRTAASRSPGRSTAR